MSFEGGDGNESWESENGGRVIEDYPRSPYDKSDFAAIREEERKEKEKQRIQSDFDRDTEKIRHERNLIRQNNLGHNQEHFWEKVEALDDPAKEMKMKTLQEKVESLRKEYNEALRQRNEYAEKQRSKGFLKRAMEFLFSPRGASTSDQLDMVVLNNRVHESLAAYRAAKKELEGEEGPNPSHESMRSNGSSSSVPSVESDWN